MQTNQWKFTGDQLLTKSPIELKYESTVSVLRWSIFLCDKYKDSSTNCQFLLAMVPHDFKIEQYSFRIRDLRITWVQDVIYC